MPRNKDKPLILLVDDMPKNLQVLGNILSEDEFDIAIATDGSQALKIINEIKPDLILLDIIMPEIDGYEVCKKIKSSEETSGIPIIFITAKTETEDIVKGFSLGAVDYVTKPFNSVELLARVKTHIELKLARDRQEELIASLKEALAEVKQLSSILPICSHCKKIRDDEGYWQQVEKYFAERSDTKFSHSICPDCLQEHYPEFADSILSED